MASRSEKKSYNVKTVFGREARFKGDLKFQDSLRIDGSFEGTIESPGFLFVSGGAVVVADISTETLIVGGTVTGNVQTTGRLEILNSGRIIGNVRCPVLVMANGTSVQGQYEMLESSADIDIFSMPLEQLKKSIKRVE